MTRRFRENCFPRFGDCFKRVVPCDLMKLAGRKGSFLKFYAVKLSIKIG